MRLLLLLCAVLLGGPAFAQSDSVQTELARGRYLVETIAGCGNCHTPQGPGGPIAGMALAGNQVVDDNPAFRAVAPNITPDRETGIGAWTDAQLFRAIREGIRPDGSLIGPPMPFQFYRGLADADVRAMIAYLRSLRPVRNVSEKSVYRIKLPPAYGPPVGAIAAPPKADRVAYGAYLAGPMGHCLDCHTPLTEHGRDMARAGQGGQQFPGPWGVSVAADITAHGLGNWRDAEIERAIRTGVSRDGRKLLPPMAFAYYKNIAPDDMGALIGYLRTLK
ncbi:MAG: cytochrome C [Acetobacteraceae bacterium SCN 69-10]|nr:c-type cytochrome [Rhodospirillales bacterium]ODU55865.1 MAG: cytochrome C [Acetobacteraceae bacterium SCN 69-10]OJY64898.1 MAG: cytochrome C [Rhodospirillales bacterium 70-18]